MILVCICLLASPRVQAQGFTPSKNYQAIQYNTYSASGLHLQSDVKHRPHTPLYLKQGGSSSIMRTGSSGAASLTPQSAHRTPHTASLTTHTAFGVGAWLGQVSSVGGVISEVHVVKQKLPPSKPGNPTYVPLGHTPWLLLSLLTLAYALRLSRRARKD